MQNLINHFHSKYKIIFSTDVVGWFGNPIKAIKFWESFLHSDNFGIELITFRHQNYKDFLKNYSKYIAGFHGRTDSTLYPLSDELIMRPINSVIYSPKSLIKLSSKLNSQHYINHHDLIIKSEGLPEKVNPNQYIVCENDNLLGSLQRSTEYGKKYDGQIFDIVHWCIERNGGIKTGWEKYLDESLIVLKNLGRCLVHISWGWDKKDALPDDLPDEWLVKLSEVVKSTNSFPIIECQWGLARGSFGCNPGSDPTKLSYVKTIISRLNLAGIIQ